MDHTIANLQMLSYLTKRKLRGFLFHRDTVFTAVMDGGILFDRIDGGYVSVFSCSEKSVGVYLKNLKYELNNAVLENSFPLGVSNEFIGKESSVVVEKGTLLVSFPGGAEKLLRFS